MSDLVLWVDGAALAKAREARKVRRQWGEWLEGKPWDHYVTLTFASPMSVEGSKKGFKRWIRSLEHQLGRATEWFMVLEATAVGVPHLHALVHGTSPLAIDTMRTRWGHGFTKIRHYKPGCGAAFYISKSLAGPRCDYEFEFLPTSV